MSKLKNKLKSLELSSEKRDDFVILNLSESMSMSLNGAAKTNPSCNNKSCSGSNGKASDDNNKSCSNSSCSTNGMNNDGCSNTSCN